MQMGNPPIQGFGRAHLNFNISWSSGECGLYQVSPSSPSFFLPSSAPLSPRTHSSLFNCSEIPIPSSPQLVAHDCFAVPHLCDCVSYQSLGDIPRGTVT